MNPSTSSSHHPSEFRKFEGFSICYHPMTPMQWLEEAYDQIAVVVPLAQGGTQLALPPASQRLAPGQACIIPAQQRHQLRLTQSGELLMIFLERQFISQSINSIFLSSSWCFTQPQIIEDSVIQFVAQNLKKKISRTDAIAQHYCKALSQILAIHLVDRYTETKPLPKPQKTGIFCDKVVPILEHIHNHLDSELKVSDLATMAGLSAPHFCRVFKKSMALSPHRYILLQRVDRAKELLQESELTLSEIAIQCGFYDQSHFSLQFRNFTGMTPKSYRQAKPGGLRDSIPVGTTPIKGPARNE